MTEFKIPLNASNYTSEERKKAFQKALEDDHQVSMDTNHKAETDEQPALNESIRKKAPRQTDSTRPQKRPQPPGPGMEKLIDSIDEGLAHSYEHQNRTLEVHQQYLSQQDDYADVFSEVLNQQRMLLENQNGEPIKEILETLHSNLEGFHKLQEKGLEVHRQFLDQQAAYAEAYVRLLQQQQQAVNGGQVSTPELPSMPERSDTPSIREKVDTTPEIDAYREAVPTPEARPEPAGKTTPASPVEADESGQKQTPAADSPSGEETQAPESAVSIQDLSNTLLEIVGDKTGYPPDMLELEMDMEADLGIDSIKRVEILGALEDAYPDLPPADTNQLAELRTLQEIVEYMESIAAGTDQIADPGPVQEEEDGPAQEQPSPVPAKPDATTQKEGRDNGKSRLDLEALSETLLDIVGEKTGYPPEMLELDMDMEADLGIDSIKRVEILGAMEDRTQDLPSFETETLAELRTLGEIVEYMSDVKEEAAQPSSPEQEPKKKVPEDNIQVNAVQTVPLPPPDKIELEIPENRPLLIGDDGSPLAGRLAEVLQDRGWNVVRWAYPASTLPGGQQDINSGTGPRFELPSISDQDIADGLDALRRRYGQIAGFIHLHPRPREKGTRQDRKLVKTAFLTAKHLKEDLEHPPQDSRSYFLTVTRYDGKLATQTNGYFGDGSGLPGLTKTLRWEWPHTYCRAIDLDPALEAGEQARAILKEMEDANQGLTEVGISPAGRVTLRQKATQP